MLRVYPASKMVTEQEVWLEVQETWTEVLLVARWLKRARLARDAGVPEDVSPEAARLFWAENHADVAAADCVVVYARDGERLRGGLVEAGVAIGLGKPIYVVGNHLDYGTWRHHYAVRGVPDLVALRMILAGVAEYQKTAIRDVRTCYQDGSEALVRGVPRG